MSSNSGPAKVRVLSTARPHGIPARRREDIGSGSRSEDQDTVTPLPVAGTTNAQATDASGSLLWIAGAIVLFVLGSTVGGLLVTISLLFPGVFQ